MDWKHLLAYISGSVAEERLILRHQIEGRPPLSDTERRTLAEIGKTLSKQTLEEVVSIVKPDTLLGWHHKLVAQKYDRSKQRKYPGRPRVAPELEVLVVRFARENRSWGNERIQGALKHRGYSISDQSHPISLDPVGK